MRTRRMCMAAAVAALMVMAGAQARADEVKVTEGTLTLPWFTSEPVYKADPGSAKALYPQKDSRKAAGERTFRTVELENRFVRVVVLPELGGVIARAVYKPTGDDFFFFEGKAKDWLPWWESGVKVSFPYYEHGLGTDQPASWVVVDAPGGGKRLAMWMEFSRHNEPYQRRRYGRYSNMTLSQLVTLRPDESLFSVTYRIDNPAPYRQGRRLWNDTLLPRSQTAEGAVQGPAVPPDVTETEWVFPARYASDHGGAGFGPYDPALSRIASRKGGSYSVFAWDIPFGFAGLYYPTGDLNRLRLFDPQKAPGAKQWFIGEGGYKPEGANPHMYNFCELWGGTDSVFEGPENWIGPGEAFAMTYRYTVVKGIGKAEYANEHVAVRLDADAKPPVLHVVTFTPVEALTVRLDGKQVAEASGVGPTSPAAIELPAGTPGGTFELTAGDRVLMKERLPLALPDDTSRHEAIRRALANGPVNSEMRGNADEQGRTYRTAIRDYPEGSTARGRVLLRDGRIDDAAADLEKAVAADPGDGEAWHLLGAARLEAGKHEAAREAFEKAVEAKAPYPPALYFLALDDLRRGDAKAAAGVLAKLLAAEPDHWEGRLLAAWLATGQGDASRARALVLADPADPRGWFVLAKAATGDEAKAAESNLKRLLAEPGATPRLEEFKAATDGRYVAPKRIEG